MILTMRPIDRIVREGVDGLETLAGLVVFWAATIDKTERSGGVDVGASLSLDI
jgi:hypothetical protein